MGWLILAQIVITAGRIIYNHYKHDDEEEEDGPGEIPLAKDGGSIPMVIGRCRVKQPLVVWHDEPRAEVVRKKAQTFDPTSASVYKSYGRDLSGAQYISTMDMVISVGTSDTFTHSVIHKVFFGEHVRAFSGFGLNSDGAVERLITDRDRVLFGAAGEGGGVGAVQYVTKGGDVSTHSGRIYGYLGSFTQIENTIIRDLQVAEYGADTGGGALRGFMHVVFDDFGFGETGRPPAVSFEVSMNANNPTVNGRVDNSLDKGANPAAALYNLLIDDWRGLGMSHTDINGASFDAAADYLDATDKLAFSRVYYNGEEAMKVIQDILKHIDGVIYVSPVDQKVNLKLIREDYTVGSLDTYSVSEISTVEDYSTTTWAETFNEVRVDYLDRSAAYAKRTVFAQDMGSINSTGGRRTTTRSFLGAKTATEANYLVGRELKSLSVPLITVTLIMDRRAIELVPGDVFKWTWPDYGITEMVLRVLATDHGTLEDGKLRVMCARDQFSSATAPFITPEWADRIRPANPTGPRGDAMELVEAPVWVTGNYGSTGISAETVNDILARLIGYARPPTGTQHLTGTHSFTSEVASIPSNGGGAGPDNSTVSYMRDAVDSPWTAYAEIESIYSADNGPLDTSVGIRLKNVDATSFLGTATDDEIRLGANLVKIGDEYVAYRDFDDLGGGVYRLNNVWRGLLDTVAQSHLVGQSVWLLSQAATTAVGETVFPGDSELSVRFLGNTALEVAEAQDAANLPVVLTHRARRPLVPDEVTAYVDGYGRVTADGETEYTNNETPGDLLDASHTPVISQLGINSASDLGDVYTNDIRMSWLRRNRLHSQVTLPTDADQLPTRDDGVRYQIEAKLDTDTSWQVLGSTDVFDAAGVTNIGNFGYCTSGLVGCGPAKLRVSALRLIDLGSEDTSLFQREIAFTSQACRQLLLNRKIIPSWDFTDPQNLDNLHVGSNEYSVRGWANDAWRTWADGEFFASPRYIRFLTSDLTTEYLEQGAGEGNLMINSPRIDEPSPFSFQDPPAISQRCKVPYDYTTGSEVYLSYYVATWTGDGGTHTAKTWIKTYNASGAELSSDFDIQSLMSADWAYREHSVTGLLADVAEIEVIVQLINVADATPVPNVAVSNLDLRMIPKGTTQQLTNNGFATNLASWLQGTDTWQHIPGSSGLGDPLNADDDTGWLLAPLSAATTSTIYQDVTIPADFHEGDIAHLRWWSMNTAAGDNDTNSAKLEMMTSVSVVLDSETSPVVSWDIKGTWRPREMYIRVPAKADKVRVTLIAGLVSGSDASVGFDNIDLRFYRQDPRSIPIFDFSAPTVQSLPCCAKEMREQSATPLLSPYEIWNFQEPTGDNLGLIRNISLTGTVALQGAPAYGIDISSDGSYATNRVALEFKTGATDGDSEYKSVSAITDSWTVNSDAESYGGIVVFRSARTSVGGVILGKRGSGASEPYWTLSMTTGGAIVLTVYDGTSTNTRTLADNFATGAWHMIGYVVDRTLDQIRIYSDQGEVVAPNSIAGRGTFDSSTNPFQVGSSWVACAAVQLRYFAHFRDDHAEAMDQTVIDALWSHAQDPSSEMDVHTRASTAIVPIAPGIAGAFTGERVPQYPIGYHSGLTDTNKLGLFDEASHTNLCPDSEVLAAWTASSVTLTNNFAVSPEGMKTAGRILQTGVGGYGTFTTGTLVASTLYTLHFWLYSVAGHSVDIKVRNQADSGDIATVTKVVPAATWTKYSLEFTTQGGQTAAPVRIYGGTTATSAGDVYCTYVGVSLGDDFEIHVPTSGGSSTGAATVYSAAMALAGDWISTSAGSARSTYVFNAQTDSNVRTIAFLETTSSGNNDVKLLIEGTGKSWLNIRNATAAVAHSLQAAVAKTVDTEVVASYRWRSGAPLDGETFHASLDDGAVVSGTGTWTHDFFTDTIYIGCDELGAEQINGVIQKLELWRGDRDDL